MFSVITRVVAFKLPVTVSGVKPVKICWSHPKADPPSGVKFPVNAPPPFNHTLLRLTELVPYTDGLLLVLEIYNPK